MRYHRLATAASRGPTDRQLAGSRDSDIQVALSAPEDSMALSARNHLPGTIEEITHDTILSHVIIRVGDHQVESVITRRSADELGLKKGDRVTAVVKATEVMIAKP
jgi:molybdopterin-binding protein